jgi:hypothetical protein
MLLEDVRKKLHRMRFVVAVLIGVSVGGLLDSSAGFVALVVNTIVWGCWFASVSHEIAGVRRLELRRRALEERVRDH